MHTEGIIPAWYRRMQWPAAINGAPQLPASSHLVVNLSGRGDKRYLYPC